MASHNGLVGSDRSLPHFPVEVGELESISDERAPCIERGHGFDDAIYFSHSHLQLGVSENSVVGRLL